MNESRYKKRIAVFLTRAGQRKFPRLKNKIAYVEGFTRHGSVRIRFEHQKGVYPWDVSWFDWKNPDVHHLEKSRRG